MHDSSAPDPLFADALRTFDLPAMKTFLAAHPWPCSTVGLPPWHWVVDNALLRMKEVNGLTARPRLTLTEVLKGVREQLVLLKDTGQDPAAVEITREKSQGGCLHRLLMMGSLVNQNPEALAQLAQCILENVPDVALTVANAAGLTAEGMLEQMGQGGSEHHLPELRRAFAARQARLRLQQMESVPRPSRRRSRT